MKFIKIFEEFVKGTEAKKINEAISPKESFKMEMLSSYLESALWTEESLDEYSIDDVDADSLVKAKEDISAFVEEAFDLLLESDLTPEQAGHDFLLTRNNHGAGFWDRGLGEIGVKLTDICKKFKEVHIYEQDGKIEIE